jgi:thermostable 8-oxoguanine DNA glycosylase
LKRNSDIIKKLKDKLTNKNKMTEEQIIEIAEKIEAEYLDLDPDVWYQICVVLLQRAD